MRPVEQRVLVPLLAVIAWVGLLVATSYPGFVSGPRPVALRAGNRLVLRATEVVDVEPEDDDEEEYDEDDEDEEETEASFGRVLGNMPASDEVESVLDGSKADWETERYRGLWYSVTKEPDRTWTDNLGREHYYFRYRRKLDGKRGEWCANFSMPDFAYQQELPWLIKMWKKKQRKMRKKKGAGAKFPNGRYIYIEQDKSPFRDTFYPEYAQKAEWYHDPSEAEWNQQKERARALRIQRQLVVEAERLEYLREIGVWPGESDDRRPMWKRQVPITPANAKQREREKKLDAYGLDS